MNGPKSVSEIDFAQLTKRKYTPSPDCWNDQVLYFLMLEDIPGKLEDMVTGRTDPAEYFGLFRNSQLDDHGNFAWFGQHVVTMFDDHDQVRKGGAKRRFAGEEALRNLTFNALAVNLTTTEFPASTAGRSSPSTAGGRPSPEDKVLRENIFGGRFGGMCSQHVHFFNEDAQLYRSIAQLIRLRREWIALRRGRQYLHEISGDGVHFGPPSKLGQRLLALVTWSRVMGDHELLIVFNTDERQEHEMYTTLNPNLRQEGDELELLFSYTPERGAGARAVAPIRPAAGEGGAVRRRAARATRLRSRRICDLFRGRASGRIERGVTPA